MKDVIIFDADPGQGVGSLYVPAWDATARVLVWPGLDHRKVDLDPMADVDRVRLVVTDPKSEKAAKDTFATLEGMGLEVSAYIGAKAGGWIRDLKYNHRIVIDDGTVVVATARNVPTDVRADRHIDYREARVFPLDALGDAKSLPRQWAEAVAASTQVDVSMAAGITLGLFSAALCGRVWVEASPTWTTPTPLWIMPVAESGERKSPALRLGISPLADAEEDLKAADQKGDLPGQGGVSRHARESIYAVAKKARKHHEDVMAKAEGGPTAEHREHLEQLLQAERAAFVPPAPRLVAADATPQALVGLLADQDGAMAMVSAEGSQVLHSLVGERGSESPVGNILSAYDAETIIRDRVSERSANNEQRGREIKDPCLTQIVLIQPGPLTTYMARGDLQRTGFTWRWIFVPVGHRGYDLKPDPPGLPGNLRQRVSARVRDLVMKFYKGDPVSLTLSPEARKVWAEIVPWSDRLTVSGGAFDDVGAASWGNKVATMALRVAGVLTLADKPGATKVSGDAMRRAFTLVRYFADCALEVFGHMDGDEAAAMGKVLRAIGTDAGRPRTSLKPWGKAAETRKVMANVNYFRGKPVARAVEVLRELEARGYITKVYGPGTKTSESGWVWTFNEPAVLAELEYLRQKEQAAKVTTKGSK